MELNASVGIDAVAAVRWVVAGLLGYFLGNIHFSILITRLIAKEDVRSQGSGNAGTTNTFRMLGMKASLLTLLGDILKASAASLAGLFLLGEYGALLGGVLCIVGHNWPVVFRFKGGKGIAATAGTLLVTEPVVALILLPLALLFIRMIKVVSIVSIGAVTAALAMTLFFKWGDWPYIAYIAAIWLLAMYSHRENIARLIKGTEMDRRLDFRKK